MHLPSISTLALIAFLASLSPISSALSNIPLNSASIPKSANNNRDHDCRYASRCHIADLFNALVSGDARTFYANVVDDVDWNVQGSHPLAGIYNNKTVFLINAVARIAKIQDASKPHSMELTNIVGGCDEEWSAQEIHVQAVMNNGFPFDNTYAWMTRWNTKGQIVQVRAYLDSALVARAVTENEPSTNATFTTARNTLEPGPGGVPDLSDILG